MAGPISRDEIFQRVLDPNEVAPAAKRARRLLIKDLTEAKLALVWEKLCKHLQAQVKNGKAVSVAAFGRFGPNRASKDRLEMSLCDNFVRQFRVQVHKLPVQFAKVLDVNYSKLSLETKLAKDEIRAIVTEVFAALGNAVLAAKQPVVLDMLPLGTLFADHRRVSFTFGERRPGSKAGPRNGEGAAFRRDAPSTARDLALVNGIADGASAREDPEGRATPEEAAAPEQLVPRLNLDQEGKRRPGTGRRSSSRSSSRSQCSSKSGKSHGRHRVFQSTTDEDDNDPIVLPVFLNRDPQGRLKKFGSVQQRMARRSHHLEHNLAGAFARMEEDMNREVEMLKQEDLEIKRRNEMSELAHQQRKLDQQREQLGLNAFLVEQAKERREREQHEKERLRSGKIIEESDGQVPFPVEREPDLKGALRSKQKFKAALQSQMKDKLRRNQEERAQTVAEERFLIDCSAKLMQADRQERLRKRVEEQRALQGQWDRQRKLAEVQRLLSEAKSGKLLVKTESEPQLPSLPSVGAEQAS